MKPSSPPIDQRSAEESNHGSDSGIVTAICGLPLWTAGVLVAVPAALGQVGPRIQSLIESIDLPIGLTLGVIGLAIAIGSFVIARGSGTSSTARPNLEAILGEVNSTPAGTTIDTRLAQLADAEVADRFEAMAELRDEVRETAVTVLSRTGRLSTAAAREQLDDGRWTDDPQAASFFSPVPPPLVVRLQEWLSGRYSVEQRLH
mgnify:CR=1 FL=1